MGIGKTSKMVVMMLFTFVLSSLFLFTSTSYAATVYEGVALKDPTNVYESTSTNSKVLKSYSEGSILLYVSHSTSWYKATVYLNGKAHTGYINVNDVENATKDVIGLHGVALKDKTAVYSKASTNSNALKSYNEGSILYYQTYASDWYKATVYLSGKAHTGYIHKSHVENATNEPVNLKGVALKNKTNVYKAASSDSSVLKSYDSGSVLYFDSFTSGWYKARVYLSGKAHTGYISVEDVDRLYSSTTPLKGVAVEKTTIYSKASSSSSALKSYSGGSLLYYETYSSKWHQAIVYVNGKRRTGYLPVSKVDELVDEQEDLRGIAVSGTTHTYSTPSTGSSIVKSYSEGSVLYYKSLTKNWHEATVYVSGKPKRVFIQRSEVENAFKEQKPLNGIAIKSPTNAYSQASRNSKAWKSYSKGSALRVLSFSESWYEATVYVDGKRQNAYFHHDDVNPDVYYETTNYNIDFNEMVDIQMSRTPKANGSGSIDASREQVEYYSNSSNFKRGTAEYLQFLVLSQPTGVNADELNQEILANKGILSGTGSAFIQGAKDYGVNELYLIAHAVHETGNGTSTLAQGVEYNGKIVYNMYGIHAFDSCPVSCGSEKAYNEGWFTPEKAIIGGAKFIGENYIARGQDTLYKMRWNPDNPGVHQYATHVRWAELQTSLISDYYGLLRNYVQIYDIPKYKNQPGASNSVPEQPSGSTGSSPATFPSGVEGITDTDGNLNLRSDPSTNNDPIGSIPDGSTIAILGNDGGSWLNVKYEGKEGWVHGNYVEIKNLGQIDVSTELNVRREPDTSKDNVITRVKDNTYVTIVLDGNNNVTKNVDGTTWYQIHVPSSDELGWVSGDYVNIIK